MKYEDVNTMIAAIENLDISDLSPSFEARLLATIDRRRQIAKQADALWHSFIGELGLQGLTPHVHSFQDAAYVSVFSEETVPWRSVCDDSPTTQPVLHLTACYRDGDWQVYRSQRSRQTPAF